MTKLLSLWRYTLTRRGFLLASSSYLAAGCSVGTRISNGATGEDLDLDRFMSMSRVLTGAEDLRDRDSGNVYLTALLDHPEHAGQLIRLWRVGGFEDSEPPTSVADLEARGVYEMPDLAILADRITVNWYSGVYTAANGEQGVATYTDALAWRTLGYRPAGPSACGGAFGHWAELPPGA